MQYVSITNTFWVSVTSLLAWKVSSCNETKKAKTTILFQLDRLKLSLPTHEKNREKVVVIFSMFTKIKHRLKKDAKLIDNVSKI